MTEFQRQSHAEIDAIIARALDGDQNGYAEVI